MNSGWCNGETWTKGRTSLLVALYAQGLTYGEIARVMGLTKNAVTGKAQRMGLARRKTRLERERKKTMSNQGQSQLPQVEIDLDSYIQTLTGQRNQALDTVAQQQGLIARLSKKLADAEAQLAAGKQHINGEDKGVRAT